MPIEIYEMRVDEEKLQSTLDENFDVFKNLVSYKFESTDENFRLNNNHKNVDLEVNRVKDLDYSVNYSKVAYFNNLSKETTLATYKVNPSLSEKKSFVINDVKIDVDKINQYSSQTSIKAYLLGDDKITSTNDPQGTKFKIALSKSDDKNVNTNNLKGVQDNLRYYLNLADPEDTLGGIFKSGAKNLDANTTHDLIDGKIPTITLYDTSNMVEVNANLEYNTTIKLPLYFKLGNNKLEPGTIKILPTSTNSGKKLNLENFEVFYISEKNGSSSIFTRQGIADKISNVLDSYIKPNGSIDKFIRLEESDRTYKKIQLDSEKASFANKSILLKKHLMGLECRK